MTPYAEKLLARVEAKRTFAVALMPFKDASKQAVSSFRLWEAGFNAFESGIPITCCNRHRLARQGWRAAAKCREWLESGEFDRLHLQAIVERISWMY